MDDIIQQVAEKLGIDPEKAHSIAESLQGQGHDLGSLLQSGDLMEKARGLLGNEDLMDKAKDLLGNVPGIGQVFENLLGGHSNENESSEDEDSESEPEEESEDESEEEPEEESEEESSEEE